MAVAVLACSATGAAAAVTDGTYTQGNVKTGAGIRMVVKDGRFTVKVVRFRETSHYGDRNFTEYFTFKTGSAARLGGTVKPDGSYRGVYRASAGKVVVSGLIAGAHASADVQESGPYDPASTTHPNACKGEKIFYAKLAGR
jgi:hypothetical protein